MTQATISNDADTLLETLGRSQENSSGRTAQRDSSNPNSSHGNENVGQLADKDATYKSKINALLEQPKYRVAAIATGVAVAGGLVLYVATGGSSATQMVQGDQTTAAAVNAQSDSINAEQAAYLEERRRQEALQMQAQGQSNAAIIITPTDQLNGNFQNPDRASVNFGASASQGLSADQEVSLADMGARYAHIYYNGRSVHNHPELEIRKDASSDRIYFWDDKRGARYDISSDGRGLVSASTNPPANYYTGQTGQAGASGSSGVSGSNTGSGSTDPDGLSILGSDDDSLESQAQTGGVTADGSVSTSQSVYDATKDADIQYHNNKLAYNFDAYQYNNQNFSQNQTQVAEAARQRADALKATRSAYGQTSLNTALDKVRGLHQPSANYGTRVYGTKEVQRNERGVSDSSFDTSGSSSGTTGVANTSLNSSDSSSSDSFGSLAQRGGDSATNGLLPNHVVRAGTTYQVVVTKTANSDVGNVVEARIANGPFAGSTVYGVMVPKGRDIGVNFTSIQRPNPRSPIIAVKAVAANFKVDKAQIATSVDRHYVQNYTAAAATSMLKGYGDAYSSRNRAGTTIERSDGTIITSTEGQSTSREVRANIAQDFSARLQKDLEHYLGERPPTFIIKAGTLLNMRITADWDTRQTVSSIPE